MRCAGRGRVAVDEVVTGEGGGALIHPYKLHELFYGLNVETGLGS